MNFEVPDFAPALPEIFVAVMAMVTLLVSAFCRNNAKALAYFLTQLTLVGAALLVYYGLKDWSHVVTFGGMYVADPSGGFLKVIVCLSVAVALLYGKDYLSDRRIDRPEYYLLVQLMTLGMMVMISGGHLLLIYIGLEMMSLSLYGMIAFNRDCRTSIEASMKYFILGALASGLLLYGMSMVYGATGSLFLDGIAQAQITGEARVTVLLMGLVFMLAGVAFKLGVAPFHMWVPDVYQGSATAVTLLLSTAPKLAALALALRLLVDGLAPMHVQWQGMLAFLAVVSVIWGNIAAIAQSNIKRMLAYSAISHMGFMLMGLVAAGSDSALLQSKGMSAAVFYGVSYVLMGLVSFGMVILLSRAGYEAENIEDFKGLAKRNGWYAAMMMIVMFSMAGIPFFIGFFAKLAVFSVLVEAGFVWLAVVAALMSVIGAFYYLRVIKVMFFDQPNDTSPIHASIDVRIMISANGLAVALLGLLPSGLFELCNNIFKVSTLG